MRGRREGIRGSPGEAEEVQRCVRCDGEEGRRGGGDQEVHETILSHPVILILEWGREE